MEVSELTTFLTNANIFTKLIGSSKETVNVLVFKELNNDELSNLKEKILDIGGKNITEKRDDFYTIITYTKSEPLNILQYSSNIEEITEWEINFIANHKEINNTTTDWINIIDIKNENIYNKDDKNDKDDKDNTY